MRSRLAILGIIAAAGMAAAQQAAQSGPLVNVPPMSQPELIRKLQSYAFHGASCPGALQARQQATGGATVWTTALEDKNENAPWVAKPTGLGIHVEFQTLTTAVKDLELSVSYLPLGLRRMPVAPAMTNAAEKSPEERAKTFNLDREAATRINADLLIGPAATITQVHLLSATFADGSVWHAPNEDACTVVPSRFMLVANK